MILVEDSRSPLGVRSVRKHLHIDFETCSRVDLKKTGASRYAADPSTLVLCVAWAWDDEPVQSRVLPDIQFMSQLIYELDRNRGVLHAWNVSFEQAILKHKFLMLFAQVDVSCSMQRALYGGLPGSLAMAVPALKLPVTYHKSVTGHRLMMKMCKPRTTGPMAGTFWHNDPQQGAMMLDHLARYCRQDVIAERAVSDMIPALPPMESQISALDREANELGVRLDPQLIDRLSTLADAETYRLNAACGALTSGVVTSPGTQTAKLTQWLADEDWPVTDIGKDTLADTMEFAADAEMPAHVQRVIGIRQQVAKSSVKKLAAMKQAMENDDCVRGSLQYYGAGRTGRWAGRLIQMQNLPRGIKGFDQGSAIFDILAGVDVDYLRTFYGEPLDVVSSCLRGCIIPRDGRVFLVYDFSQIEARVLAWLGGQQDVLDVFAQGGDVYTFTSDKMGLGSRAAGKVAVLGLGFGMGKDHFVDFAKKNNLIVTPSEAEAIVYGWRNSNPGIVSFWRALDDAVKTVLRVHGRPGTVQMMLGTDLHVRVSKAKNGEPLLTIQLPSGRSLFYRNARLGVDVAGRDTITYDGIDQYTKKWGPIRSWGAKFAENVTQAIARDIMACAARRVGAFFPYIQLLLSIHDELIFETADVLTGKVRLDAVKDVVEDVPQWATGLPIACEHGVMERYRKL